MDLPKTLADLHHAYLASCGVEQLCEALAERGVPRQGSPDVYIYECQQLGIADARMLRGRAQQSPVSLPRRFFIISAASINHEAQNALLKTMEEPRGHAVFFFLVPNPERLLPTFRSRAQLLQPSSNTNRIRIVDAKRFLKALPAARIEMLEPFTRKLKDDEERDLRSINMFLDDVERELGNALKPDAHGLRAVYRAKRHIADRGALVKPLLEQVALLV